MFQVKIIFLFKIKKGTNLIKYVMFYMRRYFVKINLLTASCVNSLWSQSKNDYKENLKLFYDLV